MVGLFGLEVHYARGQLGENGKEGKVDDEIGRRIKDGLSRLLP